MSERHITHEKGSEQQIPKHEAREHEKRAHEQREAAAEKEKHSKNETERLARKAEKEALSKEDYAQASEKTVKVEDHIRTKADKDHSFDTTMHHVHQHMSKSERVFSGFIHKPAVEKASEALGKTVARPSGLLGATVAAFFGLLSIYSVAKFAGFTLSGSEMPLLLATGFVAGLLVEWIFKSLRVIVKPNKS